MNIGRERLDVPRLFYFPFFCERGGLSLNAVLYGRNVAPTPAVEKITSWLREHPDDAEAIFKIIEGREAMERLKKG